MWSSTSQTALIANSKRAERDNALNTETPSTLDTSLFLKATAQEIVKNIEDGKWTAAEVLEAFIAQSIIAHNATNCITGVMFSEARARAKALDDEFKRTKKLRGPLHGVPISFKEQYNVTGHDSTNGFTSFANKPVDFNADLVEIMLNAGAVPFVKTNIPQTLFAYECSNPIWGKTSNPYNPAFTPGGSSGGEAALLAFDGSVIGFGSDIAGSLRIPAAYCGLYSIKPTYGRISTYGALESFPGFEGVKSVCGPMARCMDDLELACRVSFGVPGTNNDVPPMQFRNVNLPNKLKFGYYTWDGLVKGSPAVRRAILETVAALRKAGHECVEFEQTMTHDLSLVYVGLCLADGYKTLLQPLGSDPLDDSLSVLTLSPKLPKFVRNIASWGIQTFLGDPIMSEMVGISGAQPNLQGYYNLVLKRDEFKRKFNHEVWAKHGFDGIISFVHATPQTKHGGSKMLTSLSAATLIYNLVDSPCGAIPVTYVDPKTDQVDEEWIKGVGHGSSMLEDELYFKGDTHLYDPEAMKGMPVGIQLVGKPWEDEKVLAMMRVVDEALGKERGFTPGSWEKRVKRQIPLAS
ncbi:amidase [Mycena floridula]|nr:amidase [Mycena floridula]